MLLLSPTSWNYRLESLGETGEDVLASDFCGFLLESLSVVLTTPQKSLLVYPESVPG